MKRNIEEKIRTWYRESRKALLVTGARQVGKTYSIRKVLASLGVDFLEVNFFLNRDFSKRAAAANSVDDLLDLFAMVSDVPLVKGKSVIFLDEVQECPEMVTMIKFLVDEGSYRYVMSGSLLGVEYMRIASIPVGYVERLEMYPMDFMEFVEALGVNEATREHLRSRFDARVPVDESVHARMMELFRAYLVIGGMPDAVSTYLRTHNLRNVDDTQRNIVSLYRTDFSKYESDDRKLRIHTIYDGIPEQLNKQNLKFVFNLFDREMKFDRYENSFLWLSDSGVAYPVYDVSEIRLPLIQAKERNSFKLFMNDVGLLSSFHPFSYRELVLAGGEGLNLGGLYGNFVCSQLKANGLSPYYYKGKNFGEIDFLVELDSGIAAIEVKSGKGYRNHASLDRLMGLPVGERVKERLVFSNANLEKVGGVHYLPVYMASLLKGEEPHDFIFDVTGNGEEN